MPLSLLSSRFPSLHHSDGLTCLHLHRRRAQSNPSKLKQRLHTIIDEVKSHDRRCSDLSRDDLGCFCAPRPEEWWWNSENLRCQEERAGTSGMCDGVLGDPWTDFRSEEARLAEEHAKETEKDELVPAVRLRRRKSSDAYIMMRLQTRLDVLEWRESLPNSANKPPSEAKALTLTDCEPVEGNDCFLKTGGPATTMRNRSRASSGSSITLNTREEQVFFDKVRKELPAAQRTIDDKLLRCIDRLQEHCECQLCNKWRELKLGIKRQAEQKHEWKANWKFLPGRKNSIKEAGAERYAAGA
ncbi:hypothetical protein MMC11_000609 [Xylographa trunciseda]|nr:hypothetical protein [Xylographa trunciseda]